jgi:hypothetical protein
LFGQLSISLILFGQRWMRPRGAHRRPRRAAERPRRPPAAVVGLLSLGFLVVSVTMQYAEIEEKLPGLDVAFTLKNMSSWLPPGLSTRYLMAHSAMATTSVIMHLLNVASIKLGSGAAELLPSIQRLTANQPSCRSCCSYSLVQHPQRSHPKR